MPAMEPASLLRFLRKLKEVFDVCDEDADGFIRVEHFVALGLQFGQGDEVSAAPPGPRATFTCCVWPDPARAAPSPTCPHRGPRPFGSPRVVPQGSPVPLFSGWLGLSPLLGGSQSPPLGGLEPPSLRPSAAFPLSRGALPKDSPALLSQAVPEHPPALGAAQTPRVRGSVAVPFGGVFILGFVRPG